MTEAPDNWIAVGIDPGAKGAVAWLDSEGNYDASEIDTKSLGSLMWCLEEAKGALEAGYECVVGLEKVSGRGGWGAKKLFSFGGSWWVPNACLLDEGYEVEHIVPVRWQREIMGPGIAAPRNKEARKGLWVASAEDMWPDIEVTSGMADALWIAHTAAVIRGWLPERQADHV